MHYLINNWLVRLILLIPFAICTSCDKEQVGQLEEGQAFPIAALSVLKTIDGQQFSYKNKTLVINFWATWCPPCRKEMPDLQQLSNTMDMNQFAIIGISVDSDINLIKEFLLQNEIKFSNYQDDDQKLSRDSLGIRAYPETFIISPKGITIKRILGEQRWNSKAMREWLHAIHKGEKYRPGGWAFR